MMAAVSIGQWWYINIAPHTAATGHIEFLWGLLHGMMLVPNLIFSFFHDGATIYQSPNTVAEYNLGYALGALFVYGGIFWWL